jgi:microcystin-dependent protein
MTQPYIGEIRIFAGNFAPVGWMLCQGQLVPIAGNEPLFQLLGTRYGGDGQATFALPDLRGRLPLHQGNSFVLGQTGGTETVTLTTQQMPAHNHPLLASSNNAGGNAPAGNVTGQVGAIQIYREVAPATAMSGNAIGPQGGNQPHENRQPFLCVNFIIANFGVFPHT